MSESGYRRRAYLVRFFLHPAGKILAISFTLAFVLMAGVLTHYYAKYSRLIDQKLRAGPFANTSKIFAAPRLIAVGDPLTGDEIAAELRRCGYTESRGNAIGSFQMRPGWRISRSSPARIPISTRRPVSSSSPTDASPRSSPCAITRPAANISLSRN